MQSRGQQLVASKCRYSGLGRGNRDPRLGGGSSSHGDPDEEAEFKMKTSSKSKTPSKSCDTSSKLGNSYGWARIEKPGKGENERTVSPWEGGHYLYVTLGWESGPTVERKKGQSKSRYLEKKKKVEVGRGTLGSSKAGLVKNDNIRGQRGEQEEDKGLEKKRGVFKKITEEN